MELYFLFPFIYGIKPIRPLNFIPYNKDLALDELKTKAKEIGYPVVIKPVMSSSGKGQSVCENAFACVVSWQSAGLRVVC